MDLKTESSIVRSEGYDPDAFAALFEVEERHFWFRARNAVIERVARTALRGVQAPRILEIGCGTGNVLRILNRLRGSGLAVGLDVHREGLVYARQRCSAPVVQANAGHIPFVRGFDLVCMFDVLEHVADDEGALRNARDLLRPCGKCLLTVPAHMRLWSYADDFAQHCRRYEIEELTAKLSLARLKIDFVSPFMAALYPVLRVWRLLNAQAAGTTSQRFERDLKVVPILNDLVAWYLGLEARWLGTGRPLKFGASLVALATRLEDKL